MFYRLLLAGISFLSFSAVTKVASLTIVANATIYTVNPDNSWAEAIAIDDNGIILAVGNTEDIFQKYKESSPTIISMNQRLVLPGFQDAHLHAVEAGINAEICYVEETPLSDIPYWFADKSCKNGGRFADQGWIVGDGVDINVILGFLEDSSQEYPISILDKAYPNDPVFILDNIGHGAIANTMAMKIVGYDQLTQDPPGGKVIRDPDTGALTGVVLENAQQKLRDAAFPPTETNMETAYQSLLQALQTLAANGITSVSDAGGFWRQAQTESWARAETVGTLTVRASNALYIYPDQAFSDQLPELLKRFSNDTSKLVRFNQAKIYVDGILELTTGAVYDAYDSSLELPEGEQFGFEYFGDNVTLNEISKTLTEHGFQLHYHVTGDRGAGLALDAIEQSNQDSGPHRLTHLFLVDEKDRPRFKSLNVVADFQLAPSAVDPTYVSFIADILGQDRASQLLPALEIYNENATLTLSSDWDADTLSPMIKIWTVLNRPNGHSFPNLETVLPMLTLNPSKLLKTNTGSIEVGKIADLIALDMNIFQMDTANINQAKVVFTMFNGNVVFDPTGIAGTPIGVTAAPTSTSISSASQMYRNIVGVILGISVATYSMW